VARIGEALRRHPELVRQLRGRFHQPTEDIGGRPAQRIPLGPLHHLIRGRLDAGDDVRLRAGPVEDLDPLDPLHHQADAAVGPPRELVNHSHGAESVERLGRRRLRGGIALRHQRQQTVAAHHVVHEPDGPRLAHHERHRGQREDHRVPKRQDREHVRNDEAGGARRLNRHQPPPARFGRVMWSRPRS
jgi:hypothetical protein